MMDEDPCFFIAGWPCDEASRKEINVEGTIKLSEGSVKDTCEICGQDIWLGPKQVLKIEEVKTAGYKYDTVCYCCVPFLQHLNGGEEIELKHCGGVGATIEKPNEPGS